MSAIKGVDCIIQHSFTQLKLFTVQCRFFDMPGEPLGPDWNFNIAGLPKSLRTLGSRLAIRKLDLTKEIDHSGEDHLWG